MRIRIEMTVRRFYLMGFLAIWVYWLRCDDLGGVHCGVLSEEM